MNKKAQFIVVSIMVAVIIFIMAMILIEPVKESIDIARNDTALNCSSTVAYDGIAQVTTKATCAVLDVGMFYFISICIAVGLAFVSGKKSITGVLTSIFVFIVVVILIEPVKEFIILARDSSHLGCGSAGITVGTNMTCIFVDLWLFYFVVISIASAITYIFLTRVMPPSEGQQ